MALVTVKTKHWTGEHNSTHRLNALKQNGKCKLLPVMPAWFSRAINGDREAIINLKHIQPALLLQGRSKTWRHCDMKTLSVHYWPLTTRQVLPHSVRGWTHFPYYWPSIVCCSKYSCKQKRKHRATHPCEDVNMMKPAPCQNSTNCGPDIVSNGTCDQPMSTWHSRTSRALFTNRE